MKLALLPTLLLLVLAPLPRSQDIAPQANGKTAAQWVEELGGSSPDTAIAALVQLGPMAALPELVACVESRSDEYVWQASRALLSLTPGTAPERLAFAAAGERIGVSLARADRTSSNQKCVLAAIAAIGPHSGKASVRVTELLNTSTDAQTCLMAALALRRIGPKAAPDIAKILDEAPISSTFCALAGAAAYDESATALVKPLTALLTTDKTERGFLLFAANLRVLTNLVGTKKAAKAFEKRLELHEGKLTFSSRINFAVIVPENPEHRVVWLRQEIPALTGVESELLALPVAKLGSWMLLADVIRQFATKLIDDLPPLADRWTKDEFKTLDAWNKASEPARQLVEILRALTTPV